METIKKIFFLIFFSFFFNSFSIGEVRFPKLPSKKRPLSVHLQNEYFNSVSNYKLLGEYTDLPNKNFFNYVKNNFTINYSPLYSLNIELFFNTIWTASKTGKELRNKFGITHTGLGLTFLQKIKDFQIHFELRGGVPLHNIPENTDEMVIGDGSYFINPNLWFIYQHSSKLFHLFFNTNLLYRTNSFSWLLFNNIGAVFQTPFADAGFSTDLFLPIKEDAYSREPQIRWDVTDKVNGGSYKFYSINPGALSFTGWIQKKWHPLAFNLYVNIDTYGQNYAKGITLGLVTSFKWNTKTRKRSHVRKFLKKKRRTPRRSQYFEEEEDETSVEMSEELKEELNRLR